MDVLRVGQRDIFPKVNVTTEKLTVESVGVEK
jgi:hypothetical protein